MIHQGMKAPAAAAPHPLGRRVAPGAGVCDGPVLLAEGAVSYACQADHRARPARALEAVDARTVISGASLAEVRGDYSYQNCAKFFGAGGTGMRLTGGGASCEARGMRSERSVVASCAAHTDTSGWRGLLW